MTWLRTHASPAICLRLLTDVMPADAVDHEEIATLRQKVSQYKGVTQIIRKQRSTGAWGSNILGVGASKALGIKEIGTISQYRRLLEMGVRPTDRVFQLANRLFFRLLSRDDDPKLLFEYRKSAKTNPDVANWARGEMHEAATAALTHSGQIEDPRVRGAAQRVANALSHFLRSDLAEKPIIKKGARYILHPDAHPPSLYSVALIAYMPNLQRERADFIERFVQFITQPAPKKAFVIMVGSKGFKPTTQILGDPIQNDPTGRPKDLPFALHWMELLARLHALEASAPAQRALARCLKDCDDDGIWKGTRRRTFPKSPSGLVGFAFPLEISDKTADSRRVDVTFRLAHLAKLARINLEFV